MVTQELLDYLKSQTQAGVNPDELKNILLAQGWSIEDINLAFQQQSSHQTNSPSIPLPSTPTAVQKPRRKSLLGLSIFLFFLLFAAGLAYVGYFYYYLAPERVLARTIEKTSTVNSLDYAIDLSIKSKSSSFNSSSQNNASGLFANYFPNSFLTHLEGSYDANEKDKVKSKVSINVKNGVTDIAELETRSLDDYFYVKLNSMGELGLNEISKFKGQWISFNLTELQKSYVSQNSKFELTKEDQTELLSFLKTNPVLTVTEKTQSEKIAGVDSFHYKYSINKDNLIKLTDKIYSLIEADTKESFNSGDLFKNISFKDGEIWIGKNDYYLRKMNLIFETGEPNTSTVAEVVFEITLNNFNKIEGITIPENAKSYDQIMKELQSNQTS
jgi:hypothetical protein